MGVDRGAHDEGGAGHEGIDCCHGCVAANTERELRKGTLVDRIQLLQTVQN